MVGRVIIRITILSDVLVAISTRSHDPPSDRQNPTCCTHSLHTRYSLLVY